MDYSRTSETSFLSFFYETKLAYNWLTMEGGGGTIFKLIILIAAELSLLYLGKELITLSTDHKYKCYFFSLIRYSFRRFIFSTSSVFNPTASLSSPFGSVFWLYQRKPPSRLELMPYFKKKRTK